MGREINRKCERVRKRKRKISECVKDGKRERETLFGDREKDSEKIVRENER